MSKKNNEITTNDQLTDFLLYTTPDGKIKVEVYMKDENIWLTQVKIAELFGVNVPAISKHLNNIYGEGELKPESTISILETVQAEAEEKAYSEYDEFNKIQAIDSDFDKEIRKLISKNDK